MVYSLMLFLFDLFFFYEGWFDFFDWLFKRGFGLMQGSFPEYLHDGHYLLGLLVVESDVDDCPHQVLTDLVVIELFNDRSFFGAK